MNPAHSNNLAEINPRKIRLLAAAIVMAGLFFILPGSGFAQAQLNAIRGNTEQQPLIADEEIAVPKTIRIEEFYGIPYDLTGMPAGYDPSDLIVAVNDILLKLDVEIAGVKVLEQGLAWDMVRIVQTSNVDKNGQLVETKFALLLSPDVAVSPEKIISILKQEKPPTESELRQNEVEQARQDAMRSVFGDKYLSDEEKRQLTAHLAQKSAAFLQGFKEAVEKGINFGDKTVPVKIYDYYQTYGGLFARPDKRIEQPSPNQPLTAETPAVQSAGTKEISYFPNGAVEKEASYLNGKKNGPCVEYYQNGKKKTETVYADDTRVDAYREFDEKGNLTYVEHYKNGELDGEAIEYYPDGKIKSKSQYAGGKLNGQSKVYYPSGQLQYFSSYAHGKLNGLSMDYYENGQVARSMFYSDDALDGYYKSYYQSGQIEKEAQYQNGKENGDYKEFYQDGKIKLSVSYKDGVRAGVYQEYTPQGVVRYSEEYKNGVVDGAVKEFYDNGNTKLENFYRQGQLDGESKYYYESGKTKYLTTYQNGKLNGPAKDFAEDGSVIGEHRYENDVLLSGEKR